MAKIELAPIVTSARGRLGNQVFSGQGGVDFIRQFNAPANVQSNAKEFVQRVILRASELWGRLAFAQYARGFPAANPFQRAWVSYVRKRQSSAYTAFVRNYYDSTVIRQRSEDIRLVIGNAGFREVETVDFSLGVLPDEVVISFTAPQYLPDRFGAADAYVYSMSAFNPVFTVALPRNQLYFRVISDIDAGVAYSLSMQPVDGLPLDRTNVIYGAGVIYRSDVGGRVVGYSSALQRQLPRVDD